MRSKSRSRCFFSIPAYYRRMMPHTLALVLLVIASPTTSTFASTQDSPAQAASPTIPDNRPSYNSNTTAGDTKHFDPAAATQAWLDSVPSNQREKSDAYFEGGYWLILWNFLLTGAI